jgi:AcrR family transcriptional regulator
MTKRRSDGGRAQAIATARICFGQKGFHQTSMAELSERTGVSVGQIYRLFRNKSEMIAAIITEDTEEQLGRLGAIRDAVAAGDYEAREGFRRAVLDALEDCEDALTFEILAESFRNPVVGAAVDGVCDRYRLILRDLILSANRAMGGERLEAAEEMLLAMMFGLGNCTLAPNDQSPATTAEHSADMILRMLAD